MSDERSTEARPVPGMLRQGDVLLVPVENAPEAASSRQEAADGEIVLAVGERTGHAHVVRGRARTASTATASYVVVEGPATLVHEEHDPIPLVPGAYEVRRQREWTPGQGWMSEEGESWVSD